jgi:hypothetical protein
MNDNIQKLQQQLDALTASNSALNDQMIGMIDNLAEAVKEAAAQTANICGPCGMTKGSGWVLTSCQHGHVVSRRICDLCREWWTAETVHLCARCTGSVLDWAVKGDKNEDWTATWIV